MYLRNNIFIVLLAFFVGLTVIEGVQVFTGIQSTKPSWIQGSKNPHLQPQYPTQPIPEYPSEYPSEYTPYYPPQYTPPYPTQGRPQNPPQQKPTFTTPTKPQQSTPSQPPPPPPIQHQHPVHHHNQILNPSIKPTPSSASYPIPALEQYNHRFPDGSYEFRYELPDETVRYERGYFIQFHHKKSIVVRGYYSYRLPGAGYLTVFYTADQYGYRQDSYGITPQRPQLPRSLGERRILDGEESLKSESSINDNKL
ncbi:spore coat protein SP85-like [Episyrphus balteatus]|uniref:spore coat protein SP85-like n=1 Tax=Episyrphus balteatus TaxID=286459 RepID=UPI0024850B34|nr:spore coat protein SP85-like [Episyrphus balteatus]